MGFLTALGAISGAGQAGQQVFSDLIRFKAADMMETRRSELDMKKQEKMLEAQREMHRETIEATKSEKALDRGQQTAITDKTLKQTKEIAYLQESGQNSRAEGDRLARKDIAEGDRLSHENIAKLNADTQKAIAAGHDANAKDVAKINVDAQKSIHYADRLMKKYEIEMSADSATKTSTARALTEIGNETTRLTALLANPMLEPESAKALKERLTKLENIHDAYSRSMLPEGEKGAAASTKPKTLPPFQFPKNYGPAPKPGGGYPGSFKSPGVKVLPVPGDLEQEMMNRALNP